MSNTALQPSQLPNERILTINEMSNVVNYSSEFAQMSDKYICWRMRSLNGDPIPPLAYPMRLRGMAIFMCLRGSLDIEINLVPYHVDAGTICVVSPRMLFALSNIDYSDIDVRCLFVDLDFLSDVNIDLNAINVRPMIEHRSPVLKLTSDEVEIFESHISLLSLHACNDTGTVFKRNIARALIATALYNLLDFSFMRLDEVKDSTPTLNRRSLYVHDFLRLAHANYATHRSLDFYAEKLCISSKYLAVLVKEATGRSAVEWINEFVILEAKNLLRFSGKNIQQVAYTLNFANQSSFGKYFKHLTGQSPSQYQKS